MKNINAPRIQIENLGDLETCWVDLQDFAKKKQIIAIPYDGKKYYCTVHPVNFQYKNFYYKPVFFIPVAGEFTSKVFFTLSQKKEIRLFLNYKNFTSLLATSQPVFDLPY